MSQSQQRVPTRRPAQAGIGALLRAKLTRPAEASCRLVNVQQPHLPGAVIVAAKSQRAPIWRPGIRTGARGPLRAAMLNGFFQPGLRRRAIASRPPEIEIPAL